jgi:hypothetical protein
MKKKCFLNILELISGIFLIGAAIYLSGIKFYSCSNSWYLYTTDAVPIYTKVKYICESVLSSAYITNTDTIGINF